MSGAGNDFVIVSSRTSQERSKIKTFLGPASRKELAIKACNRTSGVGADGLLFLERSEKANIKWDFYNSDGSRPEMCGNAARCVVRYFSNQNNKTIKIETPAGIVYGSHIKKNITRVLVTNIKIIQNKKAVQHYKGDFVNAGVPHFVLKGNNIFKKEHLFEIGKTLRGHKAFGKKGTNVTFVERQGGHFNVISFERGVEGFTLACGTGALAAAASLFMQNPKMKSVDIKMPGGALKVQKAKEGFLLSGPADYICKGQINREVLHV